MSGAMEHVCNIAYPEFAVDSTLFREYLMAHELSHHWFGNLVTCKTSGDMWLNEGLAVFSEALFMEGKYGKKAYKDYVRENHVKVLTTAHINDNGYRALYGVPHEYTYGTTVYDKGGDVAHCLRGHMGDEKFFESLTSYVKTYSYKAASSFEFRDHLSESSGTDLTDFFDTWVFEAGFPHFSISEYDYEKADGDYELTLKIAQRLKEREFYGLNNLIDLTIIDKDLNLRHERINVSGPEEEIKLKIPFEPLNIFLDIEEKLADATVDNYMIFTDTANYDFPFTDFGVLIKDIKGKVFIQSIMNHIEAQNAIHEDFEFSDEKYWEIRGALTGKLNAEGTFYVNADENNLDADFEDLILFYRPDKNTPFKEVKTQALQISNIEGIFIVEKFKFGEYVAGIKK
jgi:aminopeptidase N